MTEPLDGPDAADDGVTHILADDDVVHVPAGTAELAESLEHLHDEHFIGDMPGWDEPDPLP